MCTGIDLSAWTTIPTLPSGFPVCTGIDPHGVWSVSNGFPRVYGDRPYPAGQSGMRYDGFPVCTGIDPSILGVFGLRGGFPRVYGDRPLSSSHCQKAPYMHGFPVCTGIDRFQTCKDACVKPPKGGFPVCTGIDPVTLICTFGYLLVWFPRVYGDRPLWSSHAQI